MMKALKVKLLEISSNGAISFSSTCPNNSKQMVFYEKDYANALFSKKYTSNQTLKNVSRARYKSMYKF